MGPLQRVVGRLHLVRDLGRSQVSNKHTIQGLNCHRLSGGFLIGHVAGFSGELDEPGCQIGNMRCIGPPETRIGLHPDERGSYIPGFLDGAKPGRQPRPAIHRA